MDICFIGVPFTPIERPLISFGLLQSILSESGIKAKTLYPNMDFAETIGVNEYYLISQYGSGFSFGDWVFSKYLFPENDNTVFPKYINEFIGKSKFTETVMREGYLDFLQTEAQRFIEDLAKEIVEKYNPRIVACSSIFDQHIACLSLLKRIKEISPSTITLMGGPNCDGIMGETNHKTFHFIDYIVSGYADTLITELIDKILEYGEAIPCSAVPNQVFAPIFRKVGYPLIHEHLEPINGKSRLLTNYPDYDDYFNKIEQTTELKSLVLPTIPIETSRGCYWGKCKFCGLNGHKGKYKQKKAREILDEVNSLSSKYNAKKIEFVDNAINVKVFSSIVDQFEAKDLSLFAEIRTDIKKDELKKLRDNGFTWLQPGIENLSDSFLNYMEKGTNMLHNIQVMKWSNQLGIHIIWSIMYNFPNENNKWYNDLLDILPKLTHLYPPKGMNNLRYDRFSYYYKNQQKFGLNLQPCEYYKFIYPLKLDVLKNIVYFFEDEKDLEMRHNPLLHILIGDHKPAVGELNKIINDWICNFQSDKKILTFEVSIDGLIKITDTRTISDTKEYYLNKLESSILRYCDEHKLIEQVYQHTLNEYCKTEIDTALESLQKRNLIFVKDNNIITLAIEQSNYVLPNNNEFPCGVILEPILVN